jgi:WD40 repeat protein
MSTTADNATTADQQPDQSGDSSGRPDAFISYSHLDVEFAERLRDALAERGKQVWVDEKAIPGAAKWAEDLLRGIEQSDAIVFLITPKSVASDECGKELSHASELNKRIIPVHIGGPVDPKNLPPALAERQLIPARGLFEENFDQSLEQLIAAIDTDLDWVREHTDWTEKALEWDRSNRDNAFLISGNELKSAEEWLRSASGKRPEPTELQAAYFHASRERVTRNLRITRGAVSIALLVAVGLSIAALIERGTAIGQRQDARSRQIAATALGQLPTNPELATLLSLRALHTAGTALAQSALRAALPQLQLQRSLSVEPPVSAIAVSPNDKLIVAGTIDGVAHLWDAGSHKELAPALGVSELSALDSVAFSHDGSKIATAYGDGTARIWSSSGHRQIGHVLNAPQGGALLSIAFSPDDRKIITAGADGLARVWDARTGKQVAVIKEPSGVVINGAVFSPNGQLIATAGGDGDAYLWSAKTYRRVLPRALPSSYSTPTYTVAFSPNGKLIATSDGTVRVWDVATGKLIQTLSARDGTIIEAAQFSPSGKQIVTAGLDGATRIWATPQEGAGSTSKTPPKTLRDPDRNSVIGATFDRSGTRVITASADGGARIFDARTGRLTDVLVNHGAEIVNGAAFSPDGRWLATGTRGGTATVWNARSGKPRLRFTAPGLPGFSRIAYSAGGHYLVAAGDDGFAYVIDASTGALIVDTRAATASATLAAAAFDPSDSTRLMTAGQDDRSSSTSKIRFWNLETDRQLGKAVTEPNDAQVSDARFSPDGSRFVTADYSGSAYVWDTRTHRMIGSPINEPTSEHSNADLNSATFSHNGRWVVTASEDGTARVWDAVSAHHRLLDTFSEQVTNGLLDAAFTPDDRFIVASSRDGSVYVWDLASHRLLMTLLGQAGAVHSVSVSPDGTRIVTAGSDGKATIWSARPSEQQGSALVHPDGQDLNTTTFSPQGTLIASASSDGTTRIWDARTHRRLHVLTQPGSPRPAVASAEFSTNGKLLVTADDNGNAIVWNVQRGSPVQRLADSSQGSLVGAVFSPNGNWIVTAGGTGARLWKATGDGHYRRTGTVFDEGNDLRWAVFSRDSSRVITAESGGAAKVWAVARPTAPLATLTEPGDEALSSAWFNPHSAQLGGRTYPGGALVVTSSDDGTARVWDVSSGAQLESITEPGRSSIYNAEFSPDGRTLLTASEDGTARLWSVSSGELLTTVYNGNAVDDAEFSPSGQAIVTAGAYGIARVFSTELAGPIDSLVAVANHRLTRSLKPSELKTYVPSG